MSLTKGFLCTSLWLKAVVTSDRRCLYRGCTLHHHFYISDVEWHRPFVTKISCRLLSLLRPALSVWWVVVPIPGCTLKPCLLRLLICRSVHSLHFSQSLLCLCNIDMQEIESWLTGLTFVDNWYEAQIHRRNGSETAIPKTALISLFK